MSKAWFWTGEPSRWRIVRGCGFWLGQRLERLAVSSKEHPSRGEYPGAMTAENARTLHAKRRHQSSILRTPFSRSARPGNEPLRSACMQIANSSVRCGAVSACGGGRFQGVLPVMANVGRNRAATKVCPFQNRLTSPLRFTAWFGTLSVGSCTAKYNVGPSDGHLKSPIESS